MASSLRTLRTRTTPMRPDPREARVQQIEDYWRQFPGAAPGGTGATGLLPNDARGYSRLLNEQTEHANLLRALDNQGPLTVIARPSAPARSSGTAGDALAAVEQSMPYYVPPPPPTEGKAPTAPPGPPAPKSPPLPPPTSARPAQTRPSASAAPPSSSASLGSLAASTGVPGAVTRYGNAYPGAPVTAAAFLPSDVTDALDTPENAAERLRQMKARIVT